MHGSSGPQEESVRRLDDQFIRFCITRHCAQHTQTERDMLSHWPRCVRHVWQEAASAHVMRAMRAIIF